MKVESKKTNKYTTQIYINGEYQGDVIKGNYGFWYSIDHLPCRSKDAIISSIIDKYQRTHQLPPPNKTK